MKLILLLVLFCVALHNGKGAPTTAVYKFVKCSPDGNQANCVTQQTKEMAWNRLLPVKLPASAAKFLDAEPVEDESPEWAEEEQEEESWEGEEEQEKDEEEDEEQLDEKLEEDEEEQKEEEGDEFQEDKNTEMAIEKGESPKEDGSGGYESFSGEGPIPAPADGGSGEMWTEKDDLFEAKLPSSMRKLFPSKPLFVEAKPEERELKEDHLLQS